MRLSCFRLYTPNSVICQWTVFVTSINEETLVLYCIVMKLVGWQEGHLARKKLSGGVLVWLSVWG